MNEEIKILENVVQSLITKVNGLNQSIETMINNDFKKQIIMLQKGTNETALKILNESLQKVETSLNDIVNDTNKIFEKKKEETINDFYRISKRKLSEVNIMNWVVLFMILLLSITSAISLYRSQNSIYQNAIEVKYRYMEQNANGALLKVLKKVDSLEKTEGIKSIAFKLK